MKSLLHLFHDSHAGSTRSAQKDSNKLRTQKSEHGSKKNADHKQKKSYSADREEKLADSVHPSRPPDAYKFPALFSFAHSTASSRYDTQRSRDHKRSKTASVIPNDSLPTPPPYHGIAIQPSDTRSINLNSKAEHQHARSFSDSKAQLNYQEIQGSAYPTRGLRDIEKPRPPNGEHREGKVNGETPSYPLPRLHSDTGQSRIADYVEKADGRTQPKVDGAGKVREKRRVQDDSKQAAVIEEHHHRSQEDRRKGKEKEVEKHKDGERERRRYRRDTEKERWGEHENMKERDERTIRSRDDKGRDRGVDMDTIKRVEGQLTGERVRQNSEKEQEKAIRKYINDKDKREGTLGGTENKVKRMERKDRDRVENRHERDPIEHQKRVQLKDPIDRAVFHFPTEKTASKHEKPVIWRPDITQPVPAVPHRTGHVEDQRVPYQPMERDTRRNNGATTNDSRYWKYKQPENNHHLGDALPSQA
ncbi:hypothetical protein AX16_003757 [Volvariella volvacea WC 439]|nr:hypothetical protein AX16_003757 [Volvariella volvacea WC 439]